MYSKDFFETVFEDKKFGSDYHSGEGASFEQTRIIMKKIPELVKQLNVKSFLDLPCGDFTFMSQIVDRIPGYIGCDVSSKLIERNKEKYPEHADKFIVLDATTQDIPAVDMIFCRDLLVHLNYENIHKILDNFKKSGSRYLLTTTFPGRVNKSIDHSYDTIFWQPLNLEAIPVNMSPPLMYINEGCTEGGGNFTDKSLGLWMLTIPK